MTTDEMQCRFMPGCGTTNPIFILRQLQDKYGALVRDDMIENRNGKQKWKTFSLKNTL